MYRGKGLPLSIIRIRTMSHRKPLFLFALLLVLTCCTGQKPNASGSLDGAENGKMKYAQLVGLKDTAVSLPRQGARVIVTTTSVCQLLDWLGLSDRIVGVCDAQYVNIPDIRRRLHLPEGAEGRIADCGSALQPNLELIAALRPDAIIASPYEAGTSGNLQRLHIPIITAKEYMEPSALGRAEWMRYYGRLFGVAERADSLFHVVDSSYSALRHYAAGLPAGRSVITERKTGAVWYVPGGKSCVADIIRDAGGSYPFTDDTHAASLPLSAEQIVAKASECDVWAFKTNDPLSREDLLREWDGYKALKAFRTGEIYECDTSVKPYFEEVGWRPDWLLREMIILLHPDARIGQLKYYKRIDSAKSDNH